MELKRLLERHADEPWRWLIARGRRGELVALYFEGRRKAKKGNKLIEVEQTYAVVATSLELVPELQEAALAAGLKVQGTPPLDQIREISALRSRGRSLEYCDQLFGVVPLRQWTASKPKIWVRLAM